MRGAKRSDEKRVVSYGDGRYGITVTALLLQLYLTKELEAAPLREGRTSSRANR